MLNLTLAKDFFLYHDMFVDISTVIDINVKCMPLSKVFKTKHRYEKYVISVNFAISSFQYKYLFRYISMWSSTKVTLFISTCVITYTCRCHSRQWKWRNASPPRASVLHPHRQHLYSQHHGGPQREDLHGRKGWLSVWASLPGKTSTEISGN